MQLFIKPISDETKPGMVYTCTRDTSHAKKIDKGQITDPLGIDKMSVPTIGRCLGLIRTTN